MIGKEQSGVFNALSRTADTASVLSGRWHLPTETTVDHTHTKSGFNCWELLLANYSTPSQEEVVVVKEYHCQPVYDCVCLHYQIAQLFIWHFFAGVLEEKEGKEAVEKLALLNFARELLPTQTSRLVVLQLLLLLSLSLSTLAIIVCKAVLF